ncbi:ABC transporter ATP-binding protein [Methylomarinum sp. Ch1-1]|uniref:ABC transporter ATP-binding protein n=1 Tax=Methylomarinum roseum TaxID=3067653 RepID=A0AAU7NQG2_9GAMM|nr:ABC transporter ATP-binding protein [Methylomarinum sp. Ch1-1]MDP4520829.1 ABC transporter ATP-binding protein [Methylomarinum sp. Ch1-1]
MSTSNAVELNGLGKDYRESGQRHQILAELSLSVTAGEFIVLLGRSGSGKSTLLNLISGIDLPDEGTVCVHDTLLNDLSEQQRTLFRRRHIGFVFQAYNLIPTLTVAENLLLPLELIKAINPVDREKVLSLLQRLGLAERADTYPDRLSGGEQQRVAIARALIHDPDIILADEPTGNLDLETGDRVMSLLNELVRQTGKTLIMATHSQELTGQADRVFTIHDKRLNELSKHR